MSVLQFFIKLPTFLTILGQIFVFDQNMLISTILIKDENGLKIVKNVANFTRVNILAESPPPGGGGAFIQGPKKKQGVN